MCGRRTESSDFLLVFLNLGSRDFVDPFRFPELLLELVETYTEDRVRCQPVGPRWSSAECGGRARKEKEDGQLVSRGIVGEQGVEVLDRLPAGSR